MITPTCTNSMTFTFGENNLATRKGIQNYFLSRNIVFVLITTFPSNLFYHFPSASSVGWLVCVALVRIVHVVEQAKIGLAGLSRGFHYFRPNRFTICS